MVNLYLGRFDVSQLAPFDWSIRTSTEPKSTGTSVFIAPSRVKDVISQNFTEAKVC